MHASFAVAAAALAGSAIAAPQGVTSAIAPQEKIPATCSENYPGKFQIQIVNVTRSGMSKRQEESTPLVSTLKNGVLTDAKGRTGYIAANNQFQYDKPAQTGAIYTAGFSVCQNGSLALGNSAIFYSCLSGTFYNLYDENTAAQCSPVYIQVLPVDGSATTAAAASQIADGQVTGSPVTQIADGQLQANTKVNAVTQIADGQIQAPTAVASNPVTQISDGQIQAPTKVANPVTQISDGQIQAPTAAPTGAVVTQIGDGQIQAPNGTVATQSPVPFTGAASTVSAGVLSLVGLLAVFAL